MNYEVRGCKDNACLLTLHGNSTATMENWTEENNALCKTFVFGTFEQAMLFMQSAAPHISQLNHHPEWQNVYNRVSVRLTTHDAGNTVTEKDRELAKILEDVKAEITA